MNQRVFQHTELLALSLFENSRMKLELGHQRRQRNCLRSCLPVWLIPGVVINGFCFCFALKGCTTCTFHSINRNRICLVPIQLKKVIIPPEQTMRSIFFVLNNWPIQTLNPLKRQIKKYLTSLSTYLLQQYIASNSSLTVNYKFTSCSESAMEHHLASLGEAAIEVVLIHPVLQVPDPQGPRLVPRRAAGRRRRRRRLRWRLAPHSWRRRARLVELRGRRRRVPRLVVLRRGRRRHCPLLLLMWRRRLHHGGVGAGLGLGVKTLAARGERRLRSAWAKRMDKVAGLRPLRLPSDPGWTAQIGPIGSGERKRLPVLYQRKQPVHGPASPNGLARFGQSFT